MFLIQLSILKLSIIILLFSLKDSEFFVQTENQYETNI